MHSVAKLFRGVRTDQEAYFRCTTCNRLLGSIGPGEKYDTLPDDIDHLLTSLYAHQESACIPE